MAGTIGIGRANWRAIQQQRHGHPWHAGFTRVVILDAIVVAVVPHIVAHLRRLEQAKVNRRLLRERFGCVVGRLEARREGNQARLHDTTHAAQHAKDAAMIAVVASQGVVLAETWLVGPSRCATATSATGQPGQSATRQEVRIGQHHAIRAADQTGKGIQATGIGLGGTQHSAHAIAQINDHIFKGRLTRVHHAVVVVILPDQIAQGQLIEAKVNRLVTVHISNRLHRVVAFVAFASRLITHRQVDGAAGHIHVNRAGCAKDRAMIGVVIGRNFAGGDLPRAVHIAHQRAGDEVAARDHHEIIRLWVARRWRQIRKGIVAAAVGRGRANQRVARAKHAIAVAVLI